MRSYDPVHVLLLTIQVRDLIVVMGNAAAAAEPDAATLRAIAERVDHATSCLQNLQTAASEYGVDPTPFTEYAAAWCGLWRQFSDPAVAIRQYPGIISNETVERFICCGTAPLEKAAAMAAKEANTPFSIRLRRLADAIRRFEEESADLTTKMGTLVIIAGMCGDFARPELQWIEEAIEAGWVTGRPEVAFNDLLAAMRQRSRLKASRRGSVMPIHLADAFERIATDAPDNDWLTVTDAAQIVVDERLVMLEDLRGPNSRTKGTNRTAVRESLTAKYLRIAKVRITRSCEAGTIVSRGKGVDRRLDPVSFDSYLQSESRRLKAIDEESVGRRA